MKRIIAILLTLLIVVSLCSCLGAQSSTQSDDSGSGSEPNKTQGTSEAETLAGKTPLEAHRAAEQYLLDINNYELVINCQSELHYGETPTKYTYSTFFKKNASNLYYLYEEEGQMVTEQYFTGGYIYYANANNKEKISVTVEEYEKSMGQPVDEVLIPLENKFFEGIKFKKDTLNGEECYVLNITITPEEYKSYTNVDVSEDASYDVYFSKDCKLIATRIKNTQLVYGAFEFNGTIFSSLTNVGTTADITPPSNAAEYRVAPAFEDIDLSTLDDISGISESAEPTDYVLIKVKDRGEILIRLFDEVAPATVANFKKLVGEGFYDGLIFHRVVNDFVIQTGSPDGSGIGGSGTNIFGEFTENGFTNNLLHKKGVVSMARSNSPNSASSQFFIMGGEGANLNGKYAAFGFVAYGQDIVDAIIAVEVDENDKPTTDVVVESIRFVSVG